MESLQAFFSFRKDWQFAVFLLAVFFVSLGIFLGLVKLFTRKKAPQSPREKRRKHSRRERRVLAVSSRLRRLREINACYAFCPVPEDMFVDYEAPTKGKFLRFDYDGAFLDFVEENADELAGRVALDRQNAQDYAAYLREVESLPAAFPSDDAGRARLREKTFRRLEAALFEEILLPPPKTEETLRVSCSYDTPAGRRHYEDEKLYSEEEILAALESARQRAESEDGTDDEDARRRRERALMTPKLRYDILKRDGFRCTICGRGAADGVKLEVDHIRPVSKGGKTVPENLRTLCFDCNRGKGDQTEDFS